MFSFRIASGLFCALGAGTCITLPATAQPPAGDMVWQRELGPALTEARKTEKGVLAFVCDSRTEDSKKCWASLYHPEVAPLIREGYVPLLIDFVSQKAVAAQLGVPNPGVVILYDKKGTAVRKLETTDLSDPSRLTQALRAASPDLHKPVPSPAASGATPTATPAPQPQAKSDSGDFRAGAIAADQVTRAHLGHELTVTGAIVNFEASAGPRLPYTMTLTERVQDPVQIVYWQEAAEAIHQGRLLPKPGDKIAAKGKLTEFRGRLQIKVQGPEQIRFE